MRLCMYHNPVLGYVYVKTAKVLRYNISCKLHYECTKYYYVYMHIKITISDTVLSIMKIVIGIHKKLLFWICAQKIVKSTQMSFVLKIALQMQKDL